VKQEPLALEWQIKQLPVPQLLPAEPEEVPDRLRDQ
jgi:hypothetical protein